MTIPLAHLGMIVQGDVIARLSDRSLFPDRSAPDPARAAVQAKRDAAEAKAMGQISLGVEG